MLCIEAIASMEDQTSHVYKIIVVKTRRTMFTKSLLSRPDEPCLQNHWCQDQTNHVYKVIGVKTRRTMFTKSLVSRPDKPFLQNHCCQDQTNHVYKVIAVGCFKILAWKITQTKLASHCCRLFQDTILEDHTNQVSKSLLSAVSRY